MAGGEGGGGGPLPWRPKSTNSDYQQGAIQQIPQHFRGGPPREQISQFFCVIFPMPPHILYRSSVEFIWHMHSKSSKQASNRILMCLASVAALDMFVASLMLVIHGVIATFNPVAGRRWKSGDCFRFNHFFFFCFWSKQRQALHNKHSGLNLKTT